MAKVRAITGKEVNWNQLFYFCEVAASGSLKSAAESLGLSSPTLSEHIAQLEKDLKVKLFHRHHRRLELTQEGAKVFQYARPMFEAGLRALDVVSPLPLGHYPVSIGLVPNPSLPLAYELIQRFVTSYPGGKITVEQASHEELERGLSESKYDFGFSHRLPERKDLRGKLARSSRLSFYVSSKHDGKSLRELMATTPLLVCGEPEVERRVEAYLESRELKSISLVRSDYPGLVADVCGRGRGIAVMSQEVGRAQRNLRELHGAQLDAADLFALWPVAGERGAAFQALEKLLLESSA